MRRLLTLVFLLCLAVPAGITISGCSRNPDAKYCNGAGYGQKISTVANIILQPATQGVTLAYGSGSLTANGQTQQLATPTAENCLGDTAAVSSYTYGSSNSQLVDVSTAGNLCAGTWNRNSGSGIADYTICTRPAAAQLSGAVDGVGGYGTATIVATADGVSSNAVTVWVHPQTTALYLSLTDSSTSSTINRCLSQNETAQIVASAYYNVNGVQTALCGTSATSACSSIIGNLTYTSSNTTVESIDANGVITALLPGTTEVTASPALTGSSGNYFSTCPPASISVLLNGDTSGSITQGVTQNLTTNVVDTRGTTITGLSLTYQSTNPITTSVASTGAITASYPGEVDVYAICEPSACSPTSTNTMGTYGTGLPVVSNPVTIITPGTASNYIWAASPLSQYFTAIQITSGSVGTPVKMPWQPNSMKMDAEGTDLYFGSPKELMVYGTTNSTLTTQATSVPGKVLAVTPTNTAVLINDPQEQTLAIYTTSSASATRWPGMAISAAWTPDAQTLYAVDSTSANGQLYCLQVSGNCTGTGLVEGTDYIYESGHTNTLYVNNSNTGWHSYSLDSGSRSLAITIPSVGAYLSGDSSLSNSTITARAWCPQGTTTIIGGQATATSTVYYPQVTGNTVTSNQSIPDDVLSATVDGEHILGAGIASTGSESVAITDLGVTIPNSSADSSSVCSVSPQSTTTTTTTTAGSGTVATMTGLTSWPQLQAAASVSLATPAESVTGLVSSQVSDLTFVTYTTPSSTDAAATLPWYLPNSTLGSAGTNGSVTLTTATTTPTGSSTNIPTAPVAGVFSPDGSQFFVSTSGDNQIHVITTQTLTDTRQYAPQLPSTSGSSTVPATILVVKPKSTT